MKKIVAIAALTLALTACTSEPPREPIVPSTKTSQAPATYSTPSPSQSRALDPDGRFITAIDDAGVKYPSRSDAINLAHRVCDALDSGFDFDQIMVIFNQPQSKYSPEDGSILMGAAVGAYCSQYSVPLVRWSEAREAGGKK